MSDIDSARRTLEDMVLRGPGKVPSSLRERIARNDDVPAALRALVDKIRQHAYRVTDEDIASLRPSFSEDELFEITISAALGASMHRLEAGLRALAEAGEDA